MSEAFPGRPDFTYRVINYSLLSRVGSNGTGVPFPLSQGGRKHAGGTLTQQGWEDVTWLGCPVRCLPSGGWGLEGPGGLAPFPPESDYSDSMLMISMTIGGSPSLSSMSERIGWVASKVPSDTFEGADICDIATPNKEVGGATVTERRLGSLLLVFLDPLEGPGLVSSMVCSFTSTSVTLAYTRRLSWDSAPPLSKGKCDLVGVVPVSSRPSGSKEYIVTDSVSDQRGSI